MSNQDQSIFCRALPRWGGDTVKGQQLERSMSFQRRWPENDEMTHEQQLKVLLEIARRLEFFVNDKGRVCVKYLVKGESPRDVLISSEAFIQWLSRKCWNEFRFKPTRHKINQAIADLRQTTKIRAKRQERDAEKQRLQLEHLQALQSAQPPIKKKRRKIKPVEEPEPVIDIGKFSQEDLIETFADTQKYDPELADEIRAYLEFWEKETGKLIDPRLREIITIHLPKGA
jgi:hypothetical protein